MSSQSSIFDIVWNPPPPSPSTIFPNLTGSRVAPPQPPQPPQQSYAPPRLSSPRLFRDIFLDLNGGSQGQQPNARRLPLFQARSDQESAQLAGAVIRTSRAVESVQEAFQARRTNSGREVVDLTESPPDPQAEGDAVTASHSRSGAESDYLSSTTHPLDSARRPSRARGVNTLNEPIFGYQPVFTADYDAPVEDRTDSLVRARARRAQVFANRHRHWHSHPRPRDTEQEEREAVRRQQENHAAWQRTQAHTRQLQNQQSPRSPSPTFSLSASSDTSPSPPPPPSPSPSPSRPSTSSSNMSKSHNSRTHASRTSASTIEAIDLTSVDSNSAVAATLAKQRADAIAAQRPDTATENGRTTLTAYKCPVCMETPINATTTICGHLFCHQCIMETLQWSAKQREEQAVGPRKKHGMCPVCRKLLAIKDGAGQGRTLVPLELRFMTMPRKRKADDDTKGKGKAKEDDPGKENRDRNKRLKREKREDTDDRLWGSFINDEVA